MTHYASRGDLEELHRLVKESKYRDEKNLIVLQGSKIVKEWLEEGHGVYAIFKTPQAPSFLDQEDDEESLEYNVEPYTLAKAIGLEQSAQNYHVAVVEKPNFIEPRFDEDTLIFDGLQDPGNVGTLMRSALAFGFKQIVLLDPSCDPFNDKVLRSSQGASLRLKLFKSSLDDFLQLLEKAPPSFSLWVAHAKCKRSHTLNEFTSQTQASSLWLVIGSEGRGPREELLNKGHLVHLPMRAGIESLNAAVAGSILASYVFQNRLDKGSIL